MKKSLRESNYESLRIISMFLIVLTHIIGHGKLLSNTTGVNHFLFQVILLFSIVHVNCFMLITGYYQSKSTFKLKKLVTLILEVAFYNLVINCILKFFGLVEYSNDEFLSRILFYNYSSYWYIKCYFIVYILSPFLNKLLDVLDKCQYKKLLICLFCCFSIFPFLTGSLFYDTNGFTIIQYIGLYFTGAYIRKYNIHKNIFKKMNVIQKRMLYIVIFISMWIINVAMFYLYQYIGNLDSNILNRVSRALIIYTQRYSNPIIIIQSISLFLFFGTFSFKNKWINKISSLTLGIYFIHESFYMRANLYKWIGIDTGSMIYGKSIIPKVFFWAIIIFTICALIELLRQILFRLLSKIKLIKKLDNQFMTWLTNLLEIK